MKSDKSNSNNCLSSGWNKTGTRKERVNLF